MRRKILLVGNFLGDSANPGVGEELARYLRDRGNIVITVSHEPHRVVRLLDMVITIWRQRREFEIAQVDLFSGLAFLWAELVCVSLRMFGKPYILTLHGGNLPAFAKRWPERVRKLLASASAVTAPSEYLFSQIQPYRKDIQLIPNPLDISKYRFRTRIDPDPLLIWLRAFHHIYNPLLAPRIVSILAQEFPNITLNMIGPDKGDGSLQMVKKAACDLGVKSRISFPGSISKAVVPEWLDRGDIFINTANIDNTPVSILEAMACGLCIVSTNVGGIPYLLQDGEDALLVLPDDADAMASAVGRILSDPDLAGRLSQNARRKAEKFDWPAILLQWENLFRSF